MRGAAVRFAVFGLVLTWFLAQSGCGGGASDATHQAVPEDVPQDVPPSLPADWDADLGLATLVDQDPAPDVVEVSLEARVSRVEIAAGKNVEAWTYAGVSPGPLIRAKVGDTLKVHYIHFRSLERAT